VVFFGQRSGDPLQWRHISRNIEERNIEDKLKYAALFQNLMKHSLKSSSAIYDCVKVQKLDVICQTRRYKANKTEIVFSWGGGGGGEGGK
jgi:hypothetical protein